MVNHATEATEHAYMHQSASLEATCREAMPANLNEKYRENFHK